MNTINEKEQFTKYSLALLADKARTYIIQNKYLIEKIKAFKQEIILVKNSITNFSNSSDKNNNNLIASKYNQQLSLLNNQLKEDINKILSKQNILYKNFIDDLNIKNRALSQLSIDNFILNNTLNKLNFRIKSLDKSIDASIAHDLFGEKKRESELDIKKSKNIFIVYNLELQQKMLSYCRAFSIYRYKNSKKLKKINNLKKKIFALIDIIKFYNSKLYEESENNNNNKAEFITNEKTSKGSNKIFIKKETYINKKKRRKSINKIYDIKISDIMNKSNKSKEDKLRKNSFEKKSLNINIKNLFMESTDINNEKKVEKTPRKKINLLKIDELLDIDNIQAEDETIINNELNSDDEVLFEQKIKPKKKISTDFISDLRKNVPIINLSQIEFNKIKVINEADAYSFQKRNLEQNDISWKVKHTKKQIKNLTKKISLNQNKLKVIHNFIEDVKYNYKLLRPIKVQSSAAGNPVTYIREKLLDIVGETINKTDKKNVMKNEKEKTEKTDYKENYEDEIVGSDYSDEDEYIEKYDENNNGNINNEIKEDVKFKNMEKNEENIDINNIDINSDLSKNKKYKNKNKDKHKNEDIKANLINKFNHEDTKENSSIHNYLDDFKYTGALSK